MSAFGRNGLWGELSRGFREVSLLAKGETKSAAIGTSGIHRTRKRMAA